MQTRNQSLSTLTPLNGAPEEFGTECPICTDEFVEPVAVCSGHVFCKPCIVKWLSKEKCNTCAICRRVLFAPSKAGRWPLGADKVRILAQTFEYSRLLTDDFDTYRCSRWTVSEVHAAAADANEYLAAGHHEIVTDGKAMIDINTLAPHIIAMGNMLEGCTRATGRWCSSYEHRDWKIIIERVHRFFSAMNGRTFEGDDLIHMAQDFKLATFFMIREERIALRSRVFFETDAPIASPAGDPDTFLDYLVHQCLKIGQQIEEYQAVQREALQREHSVVGWTVRWTRQRLFGRV